MHLILTGRDAYPEVIERARTATEMREINHASRRKMNRKRALITDL